MSDVEILTLIRDGYLRGEFTHESNKIHVRGICEVLHNDYFNRPLDGSLFVQQIRIMGAMRKLHGGFSFVYWFPNWVWECTLEEAIGTRVEFINDLIAYMSNASE